MIGIALLSSVTKHCLSFQPHHQLILLQHCLFFSSLRTTNHNFTTPLNRNLNDKMSNPENPRIIALFDVDGTLTIPRGEITEDMMNFMQALSKKITVGIVGGT